jgi:hypothetical protein
MSEVTEEARREWQQMEENVADGVAAIEYGLALLQKSAALIMTDSASDATLVGRFVVDVGTKVGELREELLSRVIINELHAEVEL